MNLLFVCPCQFGYLLDTYKHCQYMQSTHSVTYVGWDYGSVRKEKGKVDVIYVSREGNILTRYLRFMREIHHTITSKNYDACFINYYISCALVRLMRPGLLCVMDIRSGSVSKRFLTRYFKNSMIRVEAKLFSNITIISSLLAERLSLRNIQVLPVGSSPLSNLSKCYSGPRLLYVGTLDNRNIEVTLKGLVLYLLKNGTQDLLKYSIIGKGSNNQEEILAEIVKYEKLSNIVSIHGYVPFEDLGPFFDSANIGVSFIPKTDYYDAQPPTKTYDYLLSGMPVIATSTKANKQIICSENGILIEDTPEAFCAGLEEMIAKMGDWDSYAIRASVKDYRWENISAGLEAYLMKTIEESKVKLN